MASFVHTHGARLARLGHLIGASPPDAAAADAMALTLLQRRRGDGHDELMTAARHVGGYGEPPVHDDVLLQELLDRAETYPHHIDLVRLHAMTAERLSVQRVRRRSLRRRTAAGALAVVALVAGASVVTGENDDPVSAPSSATEHLERYPALYPAMESDLSLLRLSPPRRLPPGQRFAYGVAVEDTLLAGPAVRVGRAHLGGEPATVIAVPCAARVGPASLCTVAVPRGEPLRDASPTALIAMLPVPSGSRNQPIREWGPVVALTSIAEEFRDQTVLWEVTSARGKQRGEGVADGGSTAAMRYSHPSWDVTLFALVARDQMVAELWYLTDGVVLDQRSRLSR